jgi:pimeloyl-ACP methyl ester carboxylesterase
MAPVALYLASAGFNVYRCDYLDHVGLSDGEIFDFTMTVMYDSLRATLRMIEEREERPPLIVAASLANRVAIRLLAENARAIGLIGIVGVVDSRKTISKVFGEDWVAMPDEQIPPYAEFERKRICGETWMRDWNAGNWISMEATIAELRRISQPVANFCGSADDWVEIADVERAFATGDGGPRQLVELPYVEHELSSNPIAGQTVMREVVHIAAALAGIDDTDQPTEPSFEQIAEQIVYERTLEEQAAASRRPSSALSS